MEIPVGMASVNGGPPMPMSDAIDVVRRRAARKLRAAIAGADEASASRARQEADAAPEAVSSERLRSLVERIERLEEERKAPGSDIKDIYAEAKSAGFDVKALRQVIRMRTWEPAELEEHETLVDVYCPALGM
jgi:uncharacterized protein (UPF0335 family)